MEHTDLIKLYDKHTEAFAVSSTFADFIAAAPLETRMADYLPRYVGGWADRSFLTHKVHGFVARPLAMPTATTWGDLFTAVEYIDYRTQANPASRESGLCYVGGIRARNQSYSGHVAGSLYIKVRKDQTFFCHGIKGKIRDISMYARPRAEVVDVVDRDMISDRWFSIELIERDNGSVLVVARDGHHIGSRWLTLINGGEHNLMDMVDEVTRKEISDWQAYEASVKSLVSGDTVDFEGATRLGVEIVTDRY